jgi:hypothetical protein
MYDIHIYRISHSIAYIPNRTVTVTVLRTAHLRLVQVKLVKRVETAVEYRKIWPNLLAQCKDAFFCP